MKKLQSWDFESGSNCNNVQPFIAIFNRATTDNISRGTNIEQM